MKLHSIACAFVIINGLCAVESTDINNAFAKWLERQDEVQTGRYSHVTDASDLPGSDHNALLETFLMDTVANHVNSSLLEIVTGAQDLVQRDGSGFSEIVISLKNLISQLPENLRAWPLVRRIVIASLALRYERKGRFIKGAETNGAQSLLLKLFARHESSARNKGVVEFAHVSKSGGTTICQLARANGCKTESFSPNNNCLIAKFKDEPRYLDGAIHRALHGPLKTKCDNGFKTMRPRTEISCDERRRWLLRQGYTLYANEYTALGGQVDPGRAHACRNMVTLLEIRHPHDRVISHIRHVWHGYRAHCGEDRKVYFAGNYSVSHWSSLMPAPTNNYLIRSLLGQAVFNLPVGGITRAHLALARFLLAEQFDVILVLEDQEMFRQAMRYGLGWGLHERHANPGHSDPEDGLPKDLPALWELNALDTELYRFGSLMARLDAIMYEVAQGAKEDAPEAIGLAGTSRGQVQGLVGVTSLLAETTTADGSSINGSEMATGDSSELGPEQQEEQQDGNIAEKRVEGVDMLGAPQLVSSVPTAPTEGGSSKRRRSLLGRRLMTASSVASRVAGGSGSEQALIGSGLSRRDPEAMQQKPHSSAQTRPRARSPVTALQSPGFRSALGPSLSDETWPVCGWVGAGAVSNGDF
ncbi:hypothetical protein VaNZ11_008419 [Volvox africanus]|uniref:Uncharacterized protein n=1 Tax=Volvox africanus TaxID=51714 RepID=A0ABQ5S5D7_9CHLO|nr:hypothetical protein VaNZ11_008419 [Volvox africanus]